MQKDMSEQILNSSALFIKPSFMKGVARGVDLFGQLDHYNYSQTDEEADSKAVNRDWIVVGCDLDNAIKQYEQENPEQAAAYRTANI